MIRLRKFRLSDLSAMHALDQACFRPGIAYSRSDLRAFTLRPRSFCLIAEDTRGILAGFIIGEIVDKRGGLIGYVVTIDVSPGLRRQGVGLKLMRGAERKFIDSGAGWVRLEVAVDNTPAQHFYTNLNFESIGIIPDYYPDGLAAIAMEKRLFPVARRRTPAV
jgi:[ribosomal protein S18]-alanine N-acetyltransferase